MKKLVNFVFLSVFTLVLFSCSTDNVGNVNSYDDEDLITEEIFFESDSKYTTYSDDSGNFEFSAKVVYSIQADKVIDVQGDAELLLALEMTDVEFRDAIIDEIENNIEAYGKHSKCMKTCRDDYKKGEGRGDCRLACWVDTTERIVLGIFGKYREKEEKPVEESEEPVEVETDINENVEED